MAYIIFGLFGVAYSIFLETIIPKRAEKFVLFISCMAAIALVFVNPAELLIVNIANGVGFLVLTSAVPVAIMVSREKPSTVFTSSKEFMLIGAISWGIFSKVPLVIGYIFGVV